MPIDSLAQLTVKQYDSLFQCFVDKAMDKRETFDSSQPIIGIILIFMCVGAILFFLKKSKKLEEGHKKNLKDAIFWLAMLILMFSCFYLFGWIHPTMKKGFFFSHGDILLVGATVVGIIGAIWAILARIDAERAFEQSRMTYNALGSMFDFATFFEKDKLPKIYDEIGISNTNISLYLGFPIVGLPFERRNDLDIKPEELFLKLKEKLEHFKNKLDFPNPTPFEFSLYIGYIDKPEALTILKDILVNEPVLLGILINHLNDFYTLVDYFYPLDPATQKRINISDKIRFIELELKEKFRYVTVKKVDVDVKSYKKTFVWVVDFKENPKGNLEPFDSKIFQTKDERFLGLLENVFK